METGDKYIKALMDISRAINSDLYLEDLLKLIVMVTARVAGLKICSLWIVDESENYPVIRLKATQAIDQEYVKDRAIFMNEGVVGHVASTKKPMVIKDVLNEPLFKEKEMARKLNLISMLGIPLTVKNDHVVGVLNCFTEQPHDFTENEIYMITAVANQAAVAIYNQELIVKTRVIQEELETRKLVEKAKEIIMMRKNISGHDAYRSIQKHSMNTRKPIREVAEAIVLSEKLY